MAAAGIGFAHQMGAPVEPSRAGRPLAAAPATDDRPEQVLDATPRPWGGIGTPQRADPPVARRIRSESRLMASMASSVPARLPYSCW